MLCPRCDVRLERVRIGRGVLFRCPKCDGRAAGMSVLRRTCSKESLRRLWFQARHGSKASGAVCPACRRAMAELELPLDNHPDPLRLDVCPGCQFFWFDPREMESLPPAEKDRPLPQRAREILALHRVQMVAEQAERADRDDRYPSEFWQYLPAMLGMPIEQNAPSLARLPWFTYGLAAALAAVFALTVQNLPAAIAEYGLVPAEMWRHGGATFITNFFLHAGLLHLIGNVYFLLIFGDNVEDDLRWWWYAALLAAATLAGDALHILGEPRSEIPCIGASGGISGVITYYALRFPHARLGLFLRFGLLFRWISLPAWGALGLWFIMQLLLAYHQLLGIGEVSALGHLGGAAVGLAAWFVWQVGGRNERGAV